MENIVRLKNDEKPSILEYSQVESKKESHSLFWILLSAFCGLIFVRNVLHIEYPIVILLVFFCVMAFCADHNEFMALAISCVPFSAAFQYRYALFALIVIYLVKFPRSIKHYNAYIPLGAFAWSVTLRFFFCKLSSKLCGINFPLFCFIFG